jgi:hypothetical protein
VTAPPPTLTSALSLPRSRAMLRSPAGRSLAVSVGVLYAFVSLIEGQMLVFGHTGQTSITVQPIAASSSGAWWNYPALLVLAPGGVVELPFFPTVTMVIVSAGVGLGMAVGVLLAVRLLRMQKRSSTAPTLASSAAGLTPAMLALVTLGACCSTTAAATAGITAVAQSSGQSLTTVFNNTWYLGVFQMAILGVALVAQEQLVVVYGSLAKDSTAPGAPAAPSRRTVLLALLRVGLLAGGITWLLAGLLEVAAPPPGSVPAVLALQILLQHILVGGLAVSVGLFGPPALGWITGRSLPRLGARILLGLAGATMLVGAPPPLAGWGLSGFVNELLGQVGVAVSMGGVPPPFGGLALGLRWVFQFLLLGLFATSVAVLAPPIPAVDAQVSPVTPASS